MMKKFIPHFHNVILEVRSIIVTPSTTLCFVYEVDGGGCYTLVNGLVAKC